MCDRKEILLENFSCRKKRTLVYVQHGLRWAIPAVGPKFPLEIAEGLVKVRTAQAVDFERSGLWDEQLGTAVPPSLAASA